MEKIEDDTSKVGVDSPEEKQASTRISNSDTVFYDEHETLPSGKYNEGSDSGVETNGGTMGGVGADVTPVASCDSSLISCCYSFEDLVSHTIQLSEDSRELSMTAGDGTSEGGSESSSVTSYHKHPSGVRRKTPLSKTASSSPRSTTSPILSRSRTPLTRDRSLTNRNPSSSRSTQVTAKTVHLSRATSSPNPVPRSRKDHSESATRGAKVSNAKNSTTSKKSTPTDDGRWPSSVNKTHVQKNRPSIVSEKKSSVMTSSFSSVESKATALEKYATLPRRRRKSAENLSGNELKSSREPSLNRTASLRRSKVQATISAANASQSSTKTMPPYPRKVRPNKIKIYHEISIQTSLTGSDLEKGLRGSPLPDVHSRVETANCGVQVDRGSELLELLETQLKESKQQLSKMVAEKEELSQNCDKLNKDRAVNQAELQRVRALLRCKDELATSGDVISQLETEVASSNNLVQKQQQEISQLHSFCYSLQKELEKSYAAQKTILQQQQEVEAESVEMQDFLQAEKSTLSEALRDLEKELTEQKKLLAQKEAELLKQQEECTHLVRISEQRRQEQMSVEARLASVEQRSREALLHQGAAVSGASVALSRLGSRLDNLVDALVTSYNISEQDLEDVIFHNEAYSQSSGSGRVSSAESSPEHTSAAGPSGFMAAVLNAIRSATTMRNYHSATETSSEADHMLSAEPEPQAFSNRDITTLSTPQDIEKRHSISSIGSLETTMKHCEDDSFVSNGTSDESERARLANSESLQNLSLAILRRQELEQNSEEQHRDLGAMPSILPAGSLVDQVIEVDNLVTKLLKVVRIIQTINENSAIKERQHFTESVEELEEQKATAEDTIAELKREIEELRSKLNNTADSNIEQMADLQELLTDRENQLDDMGRKFNLTKQLTDSWSQAMSEVRRQYEAINSALEVLQSVQGLIQQSPALLKLQTDLKETNSQCASNLPIAVSPDLNANASLILLSTHTTTAINGTA